MGRFSKTTQIKNNTDRAGFISTFNDVMAKRGFVPCSEDEAAKSYLLAFSDGWVTFTSEAEDVPQVVKEMNVTSFSVEVVDSDFAILTLNNGDTVIFGDGSGYGIEDSPKGEQKFWEPLLANGKTWEQFCEVRDKNEVFVEDALCEAAPILGIDIKYIIADYNELLDMAESDGNIETLYFKEKTADKKSKPMTLKAAFVKVFGEALEPLGFKKIKSRYPYFVRVVPGGEIIHVITIISEQGLTRSEKAFKIRGGVATIYRGKIDLTINPRNSNWFIEITDAYSKTHQFENNFEMFKKLNRFIYVTNNHHSMTETLVNALGYTKQSMAEALVDALGYTKQFLLPVLDNVTTLSECADFYWLFHPMILSIYYDKDWGMAKDLGQSEGLMLFKIYNTRDYEAKSMEGIERFKTEMLYAMKTGRTGYTPETLDLACKRAEEQTKKDVTDFDEYFNRPQLNADVLNELQRRKIVNSDLLHQMGLNL